MMIIGITAFIIVSVCGAAICIIRAAEQAERQKYYDAAYKILKEECLDNAIKNRNSKMQDARKLMVYLKWKDTERQGYVFDPADGVWIGRDAQTNNICIREGDISLRHCVLYLYQGTVYLEDLHSRNGTRIRRGIRTRRVQEPCPVFSGDRIMVGDMVIRVTLFKFDTAYM